MAQYSIDDLLYLMSRLRDPQTGCPWDLKQTPKTIINYSIEEIYELADAIETNNGDDIQSELGDVLFQVVFFARMAEETEQFSFADVVDTVCGKLLSRHPHVFINGELYPSDNFSGEVSAPFINRSLIDESQIKKNWEKIKAGERAQKNRGGLFDDVPMALPALNRAAKLQKRAVAEGFDWPNARGALAKLKEEVQELEDLMDTADVPQDRLSEELGDVLFSCVNVARKLAINCEQALRHANNKFVSRVDAVLDKAQTERLSRDIDGRLDNEELNRLWDEVKREAK